MAELKATDVAKLVALEGMQSWAATATPPGTTWKGTSGRNLVGPIVGGTSEIQREVIAMTYGL